jgi:hypothetical protein
MANILLNCMIFYSAEYNPGAKSLPSGFRTVANTRQYPKESNPWGESRGRFGVTEGAVPFYQCPPQPSNGSKNSGISNSKPKLAKTPSRRTTDSVVRYGEPFHIDPRRPETDSYPRVGTQDGTRRISRLIETTVRQGFGTLSHGYVLEVIFCPGCSAPNPYRWRQADRELHAQSGLSLAESGLQHFVLHGFHRTASTLVQEMMPSDAIRKGAVAFGQAYSGRSRRPESVEERPESRIF